MTVLVTDNGFRVGDAVDWDYSGTHEHPTPDNVRALAGELGPGPFLIEEICELGKFESRVAATRYTFTLSRGGKPLHDARGVVCRINQVWFTKVN